MCVGINGDIVPSGERCASTTNRNFRGRQGPGARTHLMSPAMVAAAAVSGHLADVRPLLAGRKAIGAGAWKNLFGSAPRPARCHFPNLNTDQILPARYLKWPRSKGLGTVLFQDLRFDSDGNRRKIFRLTSPSGKTQKFLWRVAISAAAPRARLRFMRSTTTDFVVSLRRRFGDIFAQNAVKNGLLTAVVSDADVADMAAAVSANPERPVVVDLDGKTIACGDRTYAFEIDPVSRNQLLNGWDDVDLTESYRDRIVKFSTEHRARQALGCARSRLILASLVTCLAAATPAKRPSTVAVSKPVPRQISRCRRTRDASCRTSSREQVGKSRSVLALDAAGWIHRKSALGVKQRAGHFDCVIRRSAQLVRKKFAAVTILTADQVLVFQPPSSRRQTLRRECASPLRGSRWYRPSKLRRRVRLA